MSDIFGKISIEPDKSGPPQKKQKKSPAPPAKRKRATNRFPSREMIWLLLPIGLLTLYSIIGFLGVPYYINHFIPQQVAQKYNLSFSPGKITFNPFNFILRSESTAVADQNGATIVSLQNLELNFAPIQVLRMDFVCNRVNIDSPSIHLVRYDDGSYNISNLLPGLNKKSDGTGMMNFSDLPFLFSLNNISITNGNLVFDDKPTKKTHNIREIELQFPTLSNIAYQANSYNSPQFSALVNGSPVSFKGKNRVNEGSTLQAATQLSWELKNVLLGDYVNYLPFELPFSINKGTADGMLELTFNNHDTQEDKLSISFDLSIKDIDFETRQKKLQLSSTAMDVAGSFIPVKRVFSVSTLRLDSPEFTASSQNLLQEISEIFLINPNNPKQLVPAERPVIFSLNALHFTNGKLKQTPAAGEGRNHQEWTDLELNLSNYVSHESYKGADNKPSTLKLSGQTKEKNNIFSYTGTFESPSALSGKLSIDSMASENLFSFILPADKPFTSHGSGGLNATLTFSKNNGDKQLITSLSKVDVHLKNVKISDQNKPVIQAEELSLTGAQFGGESYSLGKITIKKGHLVYTQESSPSIFSKIDSGQYRITSLDYEGELTIQPVEKKHPPFTLKNTVIQYSNNDTSEKKRDNVVLSAGTDAGGTLNVAGSVSLNPFTMRVSTTFSSLNSSAITAFFSQPSFITQSAGELSGKGTFTFPQTAFTGNLTLSSGHYTNSADQTLSWEKLELENINYTSQPYHAGVERVALNTPRLAVSIQPETNSMAEQCIDFLRITLGKNTHLTSNQEKISISPIDIQEIEITNGQVSIKDHRLSPAWTGTIDELNGTIKDIHSSRSAQNSPLRFEGKLDGSTFIWTGSIDPFKNTKSDTHQCRLVNYPLTNFSKQLQSVSDINFNSASITLNFSSTWQNGDQSDSVESILSQLKPASLDSDSALPLAILTDKNGDVQMNFSSLQSSSPTYTSLFDNYTSNFQKRIIKGNLSPLLITSGDFSDLIDNQFIDFRPGQFMLSDAGRQTLTRYGALLIAHPNIKLALSGGISPQSDRQSLHDQLKKNEKERVEKENEKLFAIWQEKKKEYESQFNNNQDKALSSGLIAEADIPNKVLAGFRPILPEPVAVNDEMLFELAEKRLDIVRQHFITRLSLSMGRVEVVQQSMDKLSKDSGGKGVHIEILPFASPLLLRNELD